MLWDIYVGEQLAAEWIKVVKKVLKKGYIVHFHQSLLRSSEGFVWLAKPSVLHIHMAT